MHVHVCTCFNEKEGRRSKQGQTNNKAKQHSTPKIMHVLLRDEKEGRKEEASRVKQTTRQSNTAHPRRMYIIKQW